jgi:glycosyltransferase involved in cell wall biosynthesis
MVAYTKYLYDPRVRREAEILASLPDYKVIVLTLKEGDIPRTCIIEGVELQELNIRKYRGNSKIKYLLAYFSFIMLAFFRCTRLFFRNSIDVVHVHNMPNILVFSAIIPYIFGKKIILDIHDTMLETYHSKFLGGKNGFISKVLCLEESICCRLAHKIISVNHVQKQALMKRNIPGNKIIIVMNLPDPKYFDLNKKIKIRSNLLKEPLMVYHGTITKRLRLDLPIKAIAKIQNNIPGIQFNIIGGGEDREELIELSRNLGVYKNVNFMDPVPLEKLSSILENINLGIIPYSKTDATDLALPVKMLEYVALGIPVVTPRLETIKYYFSDDMVFYYEPGDIDFLANTICYACENENIMKEKAEKAREFFKKYRWETHKKDLIDLYKRI